MNRAVRADTPTAGVAKQIDWTENLTAGALTKYTGRLQDHIQSLTLGNINNVYYPNCVSLRFPLAKISMKFH